MYRLFFHALSLLCVVAFIPSVSGAEMPLVFTFLQKIESQTESETIHYVFQSGMTVVSSREASRYLDYHA